MLFELFSGTPFLVANLLTSLYPFFFLSFSFFRIAILATFLTRTWTARDSRVLEFRTTYRPPHVRSTTHAILRGLSRLYHVRESCIYRVLLLFGLVRKDERSFRSEKEHGLIGAKSDNRPNSRWNKDVSRKRISVNLDRSDIIVGPATARSDIRRNVMEGPGECPGAGKCTRREDSCIHVHVVHTSSVNPHGLIQAVLNTGTYAGMSPLENGDP